MARRRPGQPPTVASPTPIPGTNAAAVYGMEHDPSDPNYNPAAINPMTGIAQGPAIGKPPAPVTPPPPGAPANWQSLIEKYLPINVPGGSSTIFPDWNVNTTPDYTTPQWQADYTGPTYSTGAYQSNQELENRYNKPTGTTADFTTATPGEYDYLSNYLRNSLGNLVPGSQNSEYDKQLAAWMGASQFEENRQAAGLREAMGSRGARYGSDMMNAEGLFRQEAAAKTRAEAGNIQDRLNQARLQEMGIDVTGLGQVGQGKERISEAGMNRGFLAGESAQERGARLGDAERARQAQQIQAERDRQALVYNQERTRAFESGESARRATENLTTTERQHMFDTMMRKQEAAGGAYTSATNMAWQQYLMDRLPPDVVAQLLGYSTSFNPPGSVVTT